ncbi:hypothetical protein B0J17DRAFT_687186 [Rhizoctonia solani]|nr:hypothetical protein B0J17DRAFT_687186 [Rhizoctonia solani]
MNHTMHTRLATQSDFEQVEAAPSHFVNVLIRRTWSSASIALVRWCVGICTFNLLILVRGWGDASASRAKTKVFVNRHPRAIF